MAASATQAAFARREPDGRWASGPSVLGAELLGKGLAAVALFSPDRLERGVGENGGIAPGGKQLALALGAAVADAADDQPGGDRLSFARGERGARGLGDFGVGNPPRSWSSQMRRGSGSVSRPGRGWRRSRRGLCDPCAP
jgi:hypothetical protein